MAKKTIKKKSLKMLLTEKGHTNEEIDNHIIDVTDINELKKLYEEFVREEQKYLQEHLGRKEKSRLLKDKAHLIWLMSDIISKRLKKMESDYKSFGVNLELVHINEVEKLLNVLSRLASSNDHIYEVQQVSFETTRVIEIRPGIKSTETIVEQIAILGSSEALSLIDFENLKQKSQFEQIFLNIYNEGHSIVLANYDYNDLIRLGLPSNQIYILGSGFNNLVLISHNDALSKVYARLASFIEDNSADFRNMSEDDLVSAINVQQRVRKKMLKNSKGQIMETKPYRKVKL